MAFSEREIRAALRKKESQSSAQRIEDPVSDERKVSTVLRYCPHCNVMVDDDAVFCQDCGRLLSETPAPEQGTREEAKGGKSIEPISPGVQAHAPRREDLDEPWSRTLGIPKFGMIVFWVILFLIIGMVTLSHSPPPSPKTEAELQQDLADKVLADMSYMGQTYMSCVAEHGYDYKSCQDMHANLIGYRDAIAQKCAELDAWCKGMTMSQITEYSRDTPHNRDLRAVVDSFLAAAHNR